jgi:hypothetical protein
MPSHETAPRSGCSGRLQPGSTSRGTWCPGGMRGRLRTSIECGLGGVGHSRSVRELPARIAGPGRRDCRRASPLKGGHCTGSPRSFWTCACTSRACMGSPSSLSTCEMASMMHLCRGCLAPAASPGGPGARIRPSSIASGRAPASQEAQSSKASRGARGLEWCPLRPMAGTPLRGSGYGPTASSAGCDRPVLVTARSAKQ